jgi:hypothetical protein
VLQPYFQHQNLAGPHDTGVSNFNSNSVGIQFTVQWEKGAMPVRLPVTY